MCPDSHSSRSLPSSLFVLAIVLFRVSVVAVVAFSDIEDMNGFTTSAEANSRIGLQANSKITPSPSTLFKSSAYASSENRSTVILTSLPSIVSDNQSATVPPLSYTFKSKSEERLLKTTKPLNLSEVLSVSSSAAPVTALRNNEQLENSTEELNSAFTVTDNQFFTITSFYADDNSTTGNGTALTGGSSLPLMAICILASLGAFAVIVIITVTCVCHRRRKKKLQAGSLYLQTRGESSNEYENLDHVTEFADGIIPRRGNVRVYPDSSVGFHSRSGPMWLPRTHSSGLSSATAQHGLFDDYRLLNEYLLTLKRPLENYITNDSVSEDLKSYMTNASSKIFDIIGQNTGNANLRRPRIVPPLRSFAYEILYSDVFILENFVSLHLQIATLLRLFPTNEAEPIIRQCRRSLESVDALLKIGTENVSYTSFVKSGYNDVLLDANPLFRELLGQLTIVRLRLESYYLIDTLIEPDDAWKSKLLDCLTEAESAIAEAFSDVLQRSDDAEPETAAVVDQDFHQLLKSRLLKFRQSTDPVMPQVKHFLQGVNGNAAYYVSITLDEIGHLTTNILDPAAASTLPEYDELNPDFFYQNLPSIYDLPHRSVYSLPSQAEVDVNLIGSSLARDLFPIQSESEDLYEESPGALNETLGDISDAYDDDCFEVSVDRMSPSSLEDVLTLYKTQSTDQLQRSVRVSFIGESGVDGGALSREFFFMTFNSLIGQPLLSHLLFEGSRGHLLPAIDHFLTDNKVYWFVGVLIAQAVNRGCRGLPGLCNAVRHFLSLGAKIKNIGQSLEKVTVEDIADGELRVVIEKVQKKEPLTEEERSVFEDWARDSNFSKVLNPATELEAVQRIFAHYVFNSRMTQLQAISEGISDVSLRNNQASEIERMFPADEKLTYDDFMSGILIEPSTKCQRKAHKYFKRFCEELYGGKVGDLTLEMLLQFFSGAPYFVSMVGAQVRFAEPHERNALPVAHACASELIIPTVHTDYASFRGALVKALEYSGTGFGIP